MKTILFPSFLLAILSFSACAGSDQQEETTGSVTTTQPATIPAAPVTTVATDTAKSFFTDTAKPVAVPVVSQQPLPKVQAKAQPQASTAGLNPEHGKPNHRCDIPVGTPLSTPIQKTTTATTPTQTLPTQPLPAQQQPVKNASGAKLNPAHGLPGHDCAIPVGQPLKS